jgi:HK97 family phage major capsid protein
METKADVLEQSFEAMEMAGVPMARPVLEGARPHAGSGGAAFEGFLRSGAGALELKAMSGASDGAGGYAIPREIDALVDSTLASISPIRASVEEFITNTAPWRYGGRSA